MSVPAAGIVPVREGRSARAYEDDDLGLELEPRREEECPGPRGRKIITVLVPCLALGTGVLSRPLGAAAGGPATLTRPRRPQPP